MEYPRRKRNDIECLPQSNRHVRNERISLQLLTFDSCAWNTRKRLLSTARHTSLNEESAAGKVWPKEVENLFSIDLFYYEYYRKRDWTESRGFSATSRVATFRRFRDVHVRRWSWHDVILSRHSHRAWKRQSAYNVRDVEERVEHDERRHEAFSGIVCRRRVRLPRMVHSRRDDLKMSHPLSDKHNRARYTRNLFNYHYFARSELIPS